MIPCPSCGTRNRRGSKYCYRCGQRMDIVFDVSCPVCDRLNPVGSAFCAFCGAQIPAPPPAAEPAAVEQPAVAEQLAPVAEEAVESAPETAIPPAEPQRELPPWLDEEAVPQPEAAAVPVNVPSPVAAQPAPDAGKYLSDIPGALPKTEGWLSSAGKPSAKPAPQKSKAAGGCLTLVVPALLTVAALALLRGM